MSARQNIFDRIRQATGTRQDIAKISADAAELVAAPGAFQPQFAGSSLMERFIKKATSERVTATVAVIDDMAALPRQVSNYLAEQGLPRRLTLQPRDGLNTLDWQGIETKSKIELVDNVALTWADFGIAETGSVVFRSGHDAPVLMNFLPLHHLVVLRADTLLAHLEDALQAAATSTAGQPRNLCIVTGTSGTADIEAKNIRGAHGPKFMHIVIVGSP